MTINITISEIAERLATSYELDNQRDFSATCSAYKLLFGEDIHGEVIKMVRQIISERNITPINR